MDLRPIIDAAMEQRVANRGDEQHAHISDIFWCDRSSWARRAGKPLIPRHPADIWKLVMGLNYERDVAEAISAAWEAQGPLNRAFRGERIAWSPFTMRTRRHLFGARHTDHRFGTECLGCSNCMPDEREMIGHIDIHLETESELPDPYPPLAVGEVKSMWFPRSTATLHAQPQHIQQCGSYAVALDAANFFIQPLAVIRNPDNSLSLEQGQTEWFETNVYRPTIIGRAQEVIEATRPTSFEPEPNPQWEWLCKVCGYGACELNVNPLNRSLV